MSEKDEQKDLFELQRPVIKGYPELRWTGKKPYTSTQYFPAQLKESYGEPDSNGWMNKIFWGDNLQVMSHLLKDYRGKIDLIYIDPPFDSKADYKKKIKLKGKEILNDSSVFEEKQYGDIWTNDEYLQFMYERLILLRELLSSKGTIYLHCDDHKNHSLRCLMDEIFGPLNFRNEISWQKITSAKAQSAFFSNVKDTILVYTKSNDFIFNPIYLKSNKDESNYSLIEPGTGRRYGSFDFTQSGQGPARSFGGKELLPPPGKHWIWSQEKIDEGMKKGVIIFTKNGLPRVKRYLDEKKGNYLGDIWDDELVMPMSANASERIDYPTQKPESLLERIIKASSNVGDIVFDCFMGSGTTQAVALKLGRRFIGADINLGAIQTTTKRLLSIYNSLTKQDAGFEVYNVNNYDFFRNPIEAKDLLIKALEIQPYPSSNIFDGEKDGRNVKILPVNRIATKFDLNDLVANLPYSSYEKAQESNPNDPVDKITLVCMGHEPDLKGAFLQMVGKFNIDCEIVDILKDKTSLEFKRDSEADIEFDGKTLTIKEFFPMNLLQKLSLQKENVENWRQLVDSVLIDYNYDGAVLNPQIIDVPEKDGLVKGVYSIPSNHGTIKVKITDLLSESLEKEVK